jgi:hypothetical protein
MVAGPKKTAKAMRFGGLWPEPVHGVHLRIGRGAIGSMRSERSHFEEIVASLAPK